jgi:hypothetical protein
MDHVRIGDGDGQSIRSRRQPETPAPDARQAHDVDPIDGLEREHPAGRPIQDVVVERQDRDVASSRCLGCGQVEHVAFHPADGRMEAAGKMQDAQGHDVSWQ